MAHIATSRVTAAVASALLSIGILLGGAEASNGRTQNLADYGSSVTADNSTDVARSEGVPHMSDNHRGTGNYFERMDGGDR